jgi:serine/threonine protein kinase
MAPEQVRGLAVDHRADIFAFGAVLYEMLAGARAFKGETAADTMSAILTKDPPDLDQQRLAISPGLDRIIRRCLEKTPDLRFQSANDLAFALETLSAGSGATSGSAATMAAPADAAVVRPQARRNLLPWILAAAASSPRSSGGCHAGLLSPRSDSISSRASASWPAKKHRRRSRRMDRPWPMRCG